MKLLVNTPFLLLFSKTLIQHPVKRTTQLACLTSSKDQEQQIFQQRLLESYRKVDTARQRTHMTTIVKFSGFTLNAFDFLKRYYFSNLSDLRLKNYSKKLVMLLCDFYLVRGSKLINHSISSK